MQLLGDDMKIQEAEQTVQNVALAVLRRWRTLPNVICEAHVPMLQVR